MERPTIADIAKSLGVSVPTVSKVLNGRPDVAPDTRERVEKALRESNYRRRGNGRSGSSNEGTLVELVMHTIDTPWSLEIIKGVKSTAMRRGLSVVLTELGGEHRPGNEWVDEVLKRKPEGVILVLTDLDEDQQHRLRSRNIPFVVVDTFGDVPEGIPTVGADNWHGGLVATRHLLELGHRDIAVISGPREYLCSRARVDGFRGAYAEAGLEWKPDSIHWGDFDLGGGYRIGREILSAPDRPTAIFGGSDYQAFGVMRAARELGIRIPEDLSIIGFDNLPVSGWVSPSLTTVDQPLMDMAATATRMALEQGSGTSSMPDRIQLSTELVPGESTAPPGCSSKTASGLANAG